MSKKSPNNLNNQTISTIAHAGTCNMLPGKTGSNAYDNTDGGRGADFDNTVIFVDEDGNPLANVNFVSVADPTIGSTTGVDGSAMFPDVADTTMMRASYVGRKSVTKPLSEFKGGLITLQKDVSGLDTVTLSHKEIEKKLVKYAVGAGLVLGAIYLFGNSKNAQSKKKKVAALNGPKKAAKKKAKKRKKRTVRL